MPNKEGTKVIRELKENYINVPIIVISSGGQIFAKTHIDAVKILGVNAAFEKPIEKKIFKCSPKSFENLISEQGQQRGLWMAHAVKKGYPAGV